MDNSVGLLSCYWSAFLHKGSEPATTGTADEKKAAEAAFILRELTQAFDVRRNRFNFGGVHTVGNVTHQAGVTVVLTLVHAELVQLGYGVGGMLASQAREHSRFDTITVRTMTGDTGRNTTLFNTTAVNALTQCYQFFFGATGTGCLSGKVGRDVGDIFIAQTADERHHLRHAATTITDIQHLFDQVALALTGNFREGRGQAVAVSTVTSGTGCR